MARAALTCGELETHFGSFAAAENAARHGAIIIFGEWRHEHLVEIDAPAWLRSYLHYDNGQPKPVRHITVHRLVAPHLEAVFAELERRVLTALIHTWDGCWVARHMRWNPSAPLSSHAWGVACDVNAARNEFGTRGNQDPRLVEAFNHHGFSWGGRWHRPDPMHFEFTNLGEL